MSKYFIKFTNHGNVLVEGKEKAMDVIATNLGTLNRTSKVKANAILESKDDSQIMQGGTTLWDAAERQPAIIFPVTNDTTK